MEISGIIGISILKKNNKFYIIFYDDHANINYCNNKLIFISNLFQILDNNLNNINFYLEDYQENQEENFIWKNSDIIHLEKLNEMLISKKNKSNWYFTDIRLYFSSNPIEKLDYLFDINEKNKTNDLIKLKKNINHMLKFKNLKKMFQNLKEKFIIIKKNINNKENLNNYKYYSKGYLINNMIYDDKIYELDLLLDSLMELYTIMCINNTKNKINIFNYGLFHSVNFSYYLQKSNCELIYSNGVTDLNFKKKTNLEQFIDNIESCIKIDLNNIKNLLY